MGLKEFKIIVTSCKDCPYRQIFNWGCSCKLAPDDWSAGKDFETIPDLCRGRLKYKEKEEINPC